MSRKSSSSNIKVVNEEKLQLPNTARNRLNSASAVQHNRKKSCIYKLYLIIIIT